MVFAVCWKYECGKTIPFLTSVTYFQLFHFSAFIQLAVEFEANEYAGIVALDSGVFGYKIGGRLAFEPYLFNFFF